MKKKSLKTFIPFVALMILFSFVLACSGTDTEPEKVEESSSQETKEISTEEESEIYSIGDTIKMGTLQFKVNGIRTSEGGDLTEPEDGNIFIMIDTTIENTGDEETTISSILMFKLVDKDGRSYDISISGEAEGSVDGSLGAGRKMTGELEYEVPEDISEFELEIDPELFGTGIAVVEIPVNQ